LTYRPLLGKHPPPAARKLFFRAFFSERRPAPAGATVGSAGFEGAPAVNKWRDLGDVGAVGIEFVLSIAVCYWGGHWLDVRYFGGRGWLTFLGFALGVVVAFKAIYDASKRATKRMEQLERDEQAARAAATAERELKERHERSGDQQQHP
jgi:hypothetical protein